MRRHALIVCQALLVAGLLLVAPEARATVVVKLSEAQMAVQARGIVRGTVVKRESRWNKGRTRIFTYTTVRITRVIKGQPSLKTVVIRQVGGVVGKIGMRVAGSAAFKKGEQVLLFVEPAKGTPYFHVMSMSVGKYTILRHPDTNEEYAVSAPSGLSYAYWDGKGKFRIVGQTHTPAPVKVDTLVQRLNQHLLNAVRAKPAPAKPIPTLRRPPGKVVVPTLRLPRLMVAPPGRVLMPKKLVPVPRGK